MKKSQFTIFLALFISISAIGQDSIANKEFKLHLKTFQPRSKVTVFTEQHYNDSKLFDFILTADIKPYFYLFDQEHRNWSLAAVPRFNIRMLNEFSKPVRTPSYMPGLVGELKIAKGWLKSDFVGARLSVFHHSNGLNDTINKNTPHDMEFDETKFFNRFDGGFSTNYIELGLSFTQRNKQSRSPRNFITKSAINLLNGQGISEKATINSIANYYFALRHNPCIGINPELPGRYPITQFVGQYQIVNALLKPNNFLREYERIEFNFEANLSPMDKTPNFKFINRFNISATYYLSPKFFGKASGSFFFEVGYKGQDDYNIYLEDNFYYTKLGVAFGPKYSRKEN